MLQTKIFEYVTILAAIFIMPAVFGLPNCNVANEYFLEKQKFLFEIVHNVQEPLQNEEWISKGKSLMTDKTQYLDYNPLMEKYLLKVNRSSLLPVNEIFILTDQTQLEELKGLYYFLYNAQDFETLIQNICWARSHVQPQMFIFALTQILLKREDLKDLNLPKIYEIFPQHFFADKYIRNLQHFNYVQWCRTEMYDTNVINTLTCKNGQWRCEKNLQFKIYKEKDKNILPNKVYGDYRNCSKRLLELQDVAIYWLPIDFSRQLAGTREFTERSVTYLIEDKSWNAYWYYTNMGLWLNKREPNDFYSKSLRDWWFWNLQQIVVRYKMEDTTTNSITNLDPFLINFQGVKYKSMDHKASQEIRSFINDLYAKTQNALNEQTYKLENKTVLQLKNPEHLEYFLNENFAIMKVMNSFMSVKRKHNSPTGFQYFETMLRSKEFYHYAEVVIKLYNSLKANFEPYKIQDMQTVGITLNDVEVSELQTYFELVDTDVTNLMRSSDVYFEGRFLWLKSLLARQPSLQHQPFKFLFNVTSAKPQAVLVRTYLTSDCSAAAATENCAASTELFQLDTFVSNLALGYNIIERESKDFFGYTLPSLTYTELYHFTKLAMKKEYQFPLNITLRNCGFPHHLKLPKGLKGNGLPVMLVFVITSYNYRFHRAFNLDCDFSSGILTFDDHPPGFPFDREISQNIFMQDNVLIKKMKIYHNDTIPFIQG